MLDRNPITIVEIDVPHCTLAYGSSPCAASLGVTGTDKCLNFINTCQDESNFTPATKTLRFTMPIEGLPVGENLLPLLKSVSFSAADVNISGADSKSVGIGRRATCDLTFEDIPYHGRLWDNYYPERLTGAAQSSGVPFVPEDTATFWHTMRNGMRYLNNKPIRIITGYLADGQIVTTQTRYYIIKKVADASSGQVKVSGIDELDLTTGDRALIPPQNTASLFADIAADATTATLTPTGVGDEEFNTSGRLKIGKEAMSFTRVGDVLTLTERGLYEQEAQDHDEGDAVQQAWTCTKARIDDVAREIAVDYAGMDASRFPASLEAEIDRWGSLLLLTTEVYDPTPASQLLSEICQLGPTFWLDEIANHFGIKMPRPPDGDVVHDLTDDNAIKVSSVADGLDDAITRVVYLTDMIDPVAGPKDQSNFRRHYVAVDGNEEGDNRTGQVRSRVVKSRWLQGGNDIAVRIAARRYVIRQAKFPNKYTLTVDARARDVALMDIANVQTAATGDPFGRPTRAFIQITGREETVAGHELKLTGRVYAYEGRHPYFAPNAAPDYATATEAQSVSFSFFANDDGTFDDGTTAYGFI